MKIKSQFNIWRCWRKPTNKQRRVKVFLQADLPVNTRFGPYTKQCESHETKWMPLVKRVCQQREANLYGMYIKGQLYFKANRNIKKNEELSMWIPYEQELKLKLETSKNGIGNFLVEWLNLEKLNFESNRNEPIFGIQHLSNCSDFGQLASHSTQKTGFSKRTLKLLKKCQPCKIVLHDVVENNKLLKRTRSGRLIKHPKYLDDYDFNLDE